MNLEKNKLCYFLFIFLSFLLILYSFHYKFNVLPKSLNFIEEDREIKEGFVTFATDTHFGLLKVLVNSISNFSKRPVVAYGINSDIPFDHPRLIRKKISSTDCGESLYFCKPYVIWKSDIKYGVYLDVDGIVNKDVDILFDIAKAWKGNHTLSPLHPTDPDNQMHFMKKFNVTAKSMPYVHGHVIWNPLTIDFVKKWYNITNQFLGANYDETALNVLLWSMNAKHYTAAYDPYAAFWADYLDFKIVRDPITYLYLVFHGGKSAEQSQIILDKFVNFSKLNPNYESILKNTLEYCSAKSTVSDMHSLICKSG